MKLIFFPNSQPLDPDKSDPENEVGDVGKEIKKLKRNVRLFSRVNEFLKKLQKNKDITSFLLSQQMKKFSGKYEGLYEKRIPPEAQGGVFRIYFCMRKNIFLHFICIVIKKIFRVCSMI